MTAEELKRFRERHHLKVSDVAQITFSTVSAVYKWESGVRNIPRSKREILMQMDRHVIK